MLTDYIQKLKDENNSKIENLEMEIQEIVYDINEKENKKEKLNRLKNSDKNIFSPRTINLQTDTEIEEINSEIIQLKQRLDYVSQVREDERNVQQELKELYLKITEEEAGEQKENSDNDGKNIKGIQGEEEIKYSGNVLVKEDDKTKGKELKNEIREENREKEIVDELKNKDNDKRKDEIKNKVKDEVKEENKAENKEEKEINEFENILSGEDITRDKEELEQKIKEFNSLLDEIYKNADKAISYINNNKNKCKNELKKIESAIRNFEKNERYMNNN